MRHIELFPATFKSFIKLYVTQIVCIIGSPLVRHLQVQQIGEQLPRDPGQPL